MPTYKVTNDDGTDFVEQDYDHMITVEQAVKWQYADVFGVMFCQHKRIDYQGDFMKSSTTKYKFFANDGTVVGVNGDEEVYVKFSNISELRNRIAAIFLAKKNLGFE